MKYTLIHTHRRNIIIREVAQIKHILIIDDDAYIGNMLEETLARKGYCVSRAYSGTEALMVLDAKRPDLVLLDLMLPGLNGEEVLPRITGIPVIVVSAKVDVTDKVNLLLSGAADYVTKPFDTRELLARIAVALRDARGMDSDEMDYGNIKVNVSTHAAMVDNVPLKLTRTEYAILKLLMGNPRQVVTKSVLLDRISEDTPDCTETSLKMHVSNLRKKLRAAGGGDCIESVWGIGFKMKEC